MITDTLVKVGNLIKLSEPTNDSYSMFNTGGVECEVGEFLYSIVRLIKPKKVLETGTHFGISSTYMALALSHNTDDGNIITIDPVYYDEAKQLHNKMKLKKYITQIELQSEKFDTEDQFDLIFLDSEPNLRFQEFDKFYDNLKDGGIIIIHDLHPHLSYNPHTSKLLPYDHWPFGDFRDKIGKYILNNKIQIFSLKSPRGITLFQKPTLEMSYIKYINNSL